jgi:hypothetical protein
LSVQPLQNVSVGRLMRVDRPLVFGGSLVGRILLVVNGMDAGLGACLADPRAGRLDGERLASRQRLCRRQRRSAQRAGPRADRVCQLDLFQASQTPSFVVSSSASSAAAHAWIGIRPLATSWPPDRRTAEPNGAAHVFSQTSTGSSAAVRLGRKGLRPRDEAYLMGAV